MMQGLTWGPDRLKGECGRAFLYYEYYYLQCYTINELCRARLGDGFPHPLVLVLGMHAEHERI